VLKTFLRDESGASAAEYALIICLTGVGLGAAALTLGANVEAAIGGAANNVYASSNSAGLVKAGPYVPGKAPSTGGESTPVAEGGTGDAASDADDSESSVPEPPSAQPEVPANPPSPSTQPDVPSDHVPPSVQPKVPSGPEAPGKNGKHNGQCKKVKC